MTGPGIQPPGPRSAPASLVRVGWPGLTAALMLAVLLAGALLLTNRVGREMGTDPQLPKSAQAGAKPAIAIMPLANLGADPMPLTPAQFEALVKSEIETNTQLVKAAGIKVN